MMYHISRNDLHDAIYNAVKAGQHLEDGGEIVPVVVEDILSDIILNRTLPTRKGVTIYHVTANVEGLSREFTTLTRSRDGFWVGVDKDGYMFSNITSDSIREYNRRA